MTNENNAIATADDSTPADIGWAEPIAEPTRPECAPETRFAGCGSEWVRSAVLPRDRVNWHIADGHLTLVAYTGSGRIIAARSRLQDPICDGSGVYKNPDNLRFCNGEESWVEAQDAAMAYVRTLIDCAYDFWAVGVWLSYQTPRREFAGYLAGLPGWGINRQAWTPHAWREMDGLDPATIEAKKLLEDDQQGG